MILSRPLTEEEKKRSQNNLLKFNFMNGASYMCLGETILILFAVQMQCSDSIIGILGAMLYFGFLLLPLGKIMTARVGAARSQADFWILRNVAALLTAAAAPASLISHSLAVVLLLLGAFFFYGFRAAGVVMSLPLIGEICHVNEQGGFLSRLLVSFYCSSLVTLLTISVILSWQSGPWVLFAIIVIGALLGMSGSYFVRKIDETDQIRESARRPIRDSVIAVLHDRFVRHLLAANMLCYLAVILCVPISMLALKRGYQVSDMKALLFSLVQFGASIVISKFLTKSADRFGGRKMALIGSCFFYLLTAFWVLAPTTFQPVLLIVPFLFCPCAAVVTGNSLQQHFLRTVPKQQQVVANMCISLGTGAVSGLFGMILSSSLLQFAAYCNHGETSLATYRIYFLLVLILLPVLTYFIYKLDRIPPQAS